MTTSAQRIFLLASAALLLLGPGCSGSAQSSAHGNASYVAPPSQGGQKVAPQQKSDDLKVTVVLSGQAAFQPVQSAACALTSGQFSESAQTTGQVNADGTYVSDFTTESASGTGTSALCGTLKDVKPTSVTALTLQASVPANSANCSAYCQALANTQCSATDASCASTVKASCTTRCTGSTRISGHGQLSQADQATTNAQLAGGSGKLDANVDLIFDALE